MSEPRHGGVREWSNRLWRTRELRVRKRTDGAPRGSLDKPQFILQTRKRLHSTGHLRVFPLFEGVYRLDRDTMMAADHPESQLAFLHEFTNLRARNSEYLRSFCRGCFITSVCDNDSMPVRPRVDYLCQPLGRLARDVELHFITRTLKRAMKCVSVTIKKPAPARTAKLK